MLESPATSVAPELSIFQFPFSVVKICKISKKWLECQRLRLHGRNLNQKKKIYSKSWIIYFTPSNEDEKILILGHNQWDKINDQMTRLIFSCSILSDLSEDNTKDIIVLMLLHYRMYVFLMFCIWVTVYLDLHNLHCYVVSTVCPLAAFKSKRKIKSQTDWFNLFLAMVNTDPWKQSSLKRMQMECFVKVIQILCLSFPSFTFQLYNSSE